MIDSDQDSAVVTTHKSAKEKVKSLGHETKVKTKRLLRRHRHHDPEEVATQDLDDNPYDDMQQDPAFDPSQLVHQKRFPERVASNLYSGLKAIGSPRDAAKRKAAKTVAVSDRPYLSQEADMEFLEAHDSLSKARTQTSSGPRSANEQDHIDKHRDRVETLENLRQSRRVAWITSRHVKRVLVCPKREFPMPKKEDYEVTDSHTGKKSLDRWAWYRARQENAMKAFAVNHMGSVDFAGQPPFNREITQGYMERILIASSPWQSWFLSLRSLYRYENPTRTRKWAAIWFFVWYFGFPMTFTLAYVAYMVLDNRFGRKNVDAMRDSYQRSLDHGLAASRFNELITKHGAGDWAGPLVDEIGPVVQEQLCDLADCLESLHNFYDWRAPEKTWATLFWFLCAILIGALTPTGYTMRIVWMYAIGSFFMGQPVASLHPEYRHVVNSFRWIYWGIPNDPEWSMMYLRRKAQETRAKIISQKVGEEYKNDNDKNHPPEAFSGSLDVPSLTRTVSTRDDESILTDSDVDDGASYHTADSSTSILGGIDILSFKCHMRGLPGRLIIFSDGLRFERSSLTTRRKEEWRYPWQEIVEMCKVDHSAAMITTLHGIHIKFTDGEEVKMESIKHRDKAFNCIMGFSCLQFQVLQPDAPVNCHDKTLEIGGQEFYDPESPENQ